MRESTSRRSRVAAARAVVARSATAGAGAVAPRVARTGREPSTSDAAAARRGARTRGSPEVVGRVVEERPRLRVVATRPGGRLLRWGLPSLGLVALGPLQ